MADIDYEEIRRKNIAERQAEFAAFFKELKTETSEFKQKVTPRKKLARYSTDEEQENSPPRKRKRWSKKSYTSDSPRVYNTRSKSKRASQGDYSEDNDEKDNILQESSERLLPKGSRLKVIFPWAKTFEREMEVTRIDKWDVDKELAEYNEDSYDSDDSTRKRRRDIHRVSKSIYDPSTIPSPDEITEAMLENVAEKSSGKTYCKLKGTSCHQCRQKTMDTKTVCRSGECIGVRGQFCGPCLRGRYGEDAVTVLKDSNWACPPCRGLCNCSICRTRNGQRPTGILAPVAQEEGFSSVMEYLRATSGDEDDTLDS